MNYKFQFWNVYFSYFILAFWQRNITVLAQAVFTYIVFKQLGLNLVEYLLQSLFQRFQLYRVKREFKPKLEATKGLEY